MSKIKFSIGDKVAFHREVVRRVGLDKNTGDARGVVVEINDSVVSVDFGNTWVKHENGGTVRYVPAANLTRILSNGVVYE
jgi:hypothetical protein